MDLFVNVDVDDLSKGIAFYQRAFGLQIGRRFGSFAVEMLGASSAIYLLLKPDGTRSSAGTDDVRRYRRHWTPIHLRSEEHTSELQSRLHLVCRLLLEKKKKESKIGR